MPRSRTFQACVLAVVLSASGAVADRTHVAQAVAALRGVVARPRLVDTRTAAFQEIAYGRVDRADTVGVKVDNETSTTATTTAPTIMDRIWSMGRDMCEGRSADHVLCKHFRDENETSTTEAETTTPSTTTTTTTTTLVTTTATNTTAAPTTTNTTSTTTNTTTMATTTTNATTTTSAATTTTNTTTTTTKATTAAPDTTTTAAATSAVAAGEVDEKEAAAEKTEEASPPKLPGQGYEGKKVRHVDGETYTGDWLKEHTPPKEEEKKQESHQSSAHRINGRAPITLINGLPALSFFTLVLGQC